MAWVAADLKALVSQYHKTHIDMKTSLISTVLITNITTCVARLSMRDVYRINFGSQQAAPNIKADEDLLFSTE
jgi:hypothetical protein